MRGMGSIGPSSDRSFKSLFLLLLLLVTIWLFLIGVLEIGMKTTVTPQEIGNFKPKGLKKEDLNYTSKRRIPNGPDPIHNRRARKSRRPPGRA